MKTKQQKMWCYTHSKYVPSDHFLSCDGKTIQSALKSKKSVEARKPKKKSRTSKAVNYCADHGRFVGFRWCGHRRLCKAPEITRKEYLEKFHGRKKAEGRVAQFKSFQDEASNVQFEACLRLLGIRSGDFVKDLARASCDPKSFDKTSGILVKEMYRFKEAIIPSLIYHQGCVIESVRIEDGRSQTVPILCKEDFILVMKKASSSMDGKSGRVAISYRNNMGALGKVSIVIPISVHKDGEGSSAQIFVDFKDVRADLETYFKVAEDKFTRAKIKFDEAAESIKAAQEDLEEAKAEMDKVLLEKDNFSRMIKSVSNPK